MADRIDEGLLELHADSPPLAFALYLSLFHALRALLQTPDRKGLDTRATIRGTLRDMVPLTVDAIAIGIVLFLL